MAFRIERNDIANVKADAIVNTANPKPLIGSGTDAMVHAKAGPGLLEARKNIGTIRPGAAAVTPAFGLDAKFVIHTVGPRWMGGLFGEEQTLRSCYENSLKLARNLGCRSIAFPLISAGNYGFPRDRALNIATQVFNEFLTEQEMDICLVVFDGEVFRLSEKLFRDVSSYIDQHYVDEAEKYAHRPFRTNQRPVFDWREDTGALPVLHESAILEESAAYSREEAPQPMAKPRPPVEARPKAAARMPMPQMAPKKPRSLTDLMANLDAGFSETLLKLIDRSGKKDSDIYNKANVSRQHFSKIRNNPAYKPTKPTAIAFAIALELNLEQTRDLIGRAGYALTMSSKFDVIIMYFIENRNYNLHDINAALYEFDQSLLGA